MSELTTHVIKVEWATHARSLTQIRMEVFVAEQGIPAAEELDDLDPQATHFLAIDSIGREQGCVRITQAGQIGRLAVHKAYRNQGCGAMLLTAAQEFAVSLKLPKVFLNAQRDAEDFYRRAGFTATGVEFMEAGIPHIAMELMLPIPFDGELSKDSTQQDKTRAQTPYSVSQRKLRSVSSPVADPIQFATTDAALELVTQLVSNAHRRIMLFSPYLDQTLFSNQNFVDAVSKLVRNSARSEVKILLHSSKPALERGHKLLELSRRLDEKIKVRLHPEELSQDTSSFVIADTESYWLLPNWDQHHGICDSHDPVTTARMTDAFDQAWQKSQADPELRTLRL